MATYPVRKDVDLFSFLRNAMFEIPHFENESAPKKFLRLMLSNEEKGKKDIEI